MNENWTHPWVLARLTPAGGDNVARFATRQEAEAAKKAGQGDFVYDTCPGRLTDADDGHFARNNYDH